MAARMTVARKVPSKCTSDDASKPSRVRVVRSPSEAARGEAMLSGLAPARRAITTSAHMNDPRMADESEAESMPVAITRTNSKYPLRSRKAGSEGGFGW